MSERVDRRSVEIRGEQVESRRKPLKPLVPLLST